MTDDDSDEEIETTRRRGVDEHLLLDYESEQQGSVPDREVPTEHDGRGDARTDIYPRHENEGILRSDGSRVSYDHLSKINDGEWTSERKGDNHEANKLRDMGLVCSQLELVASSRDRSLYLIDQIDITELHRKATVEGVVLAIATLVGNEQGRQVRQEDVYTELREFFDVSASRVNTLRERIREHDAW